MATRKAGIPSLKLSKVFSALEPEFVLGTSFTLSLAFFESVVFQHIKRKHLKRCLLLCDQAGLEMAMSEAPALRYAAREYMVATAPTKGTFHPKVWLLLARNELLVLAGSGNLTQPGFIDNVELFDVVRVTAGGPGRAMVSDALTFVRGLIALWDGAANSGLLSVETLKEMTHVLTELEARLTVVEQAPERLLSSFMGSFPSQFARLRADTAYVASPYFGNSAAGLESFHSELGVQRTIVFPAWHSDGALDLPLSDAQRISGVSVQTLALTTGRKKFAHLKLYGFQSGASDAWIFTGSVNCTLSALYGPNVEAGILRRVGSTELDHYFAGCVMDEGNSSSHFDARTAGKGWLILWATDLGDHISIELAPMHAHHGPLTVATIELRSGQKSASTEAAHLFDLGSTERFAWRLFGDFRSRLRNAATLQLIATDAHGHAVHGQCLVDDFATLTSDPVHRSAWRAAVALLGAEGMPEFGDIAALFNLADVVSTPDDDDAALEAEQIPDSAKRVAGSTKEAIRDKAAMWPPRPLLEDAIPTGVYGHGAGNIYWFNRILAAFLQKTSAEPLVSPVGGEAIDAADEDGLSNAGSASRGLKIEAENGDEIQAAARRLWQQSYKALERIEERLKCLEITTENANRIWGPATFVFLGILHVAQAIRRRGMWLETLPSSTSLVQGWLGTVLSERDQGDDYAAPTGATYGGRFFPAVAFDLWNRFHEAPHPEILSILCLAMAHVLAVSRADQRILFSHVQWLTLRDAAGDLLAEALRDKIHLQHFWEAYFRDDEESVVWVSVNKAVSDLEGMTWMDHEGMKDLVILERFKTTNGNGDTTGLSGPLNSRLRMFKRGGFRWEEVERISESCGNSRCSRYGIDTVELGGLRELRPVICPACGCLLVPDLLNQAYRRLSDGRSS